MRIHDMRILALTFLFLLAAGCGYEKQDYPDPPAPEVNIIVDGEDPPDPGRQPGQGTSWATFQRDICSCESQRVSRSIPPFVMSLSNSCCHHQQW